MIHQLKDANHKQVSKKIKKNSETNLVDITTVELCCIKEENLDKQFIFVHHCYNSAPPAKFEGWK